ncbi:MAG: hypothetical protein K0S30_353 [Clostridia bacterium]|nr:hypothetical protein [Clostridia bacterium]
MSCCGKRNTGNFYARPYNNYVNNCANSREDDDCNCDRYDNAATNCDNLASISNPCYSNNYGCCDTLRGAACKLINQRAIIYVDDCRMCVVIIAVGECFIKTINYCTNRVVYFNLTRVNSIEEVLPRCH